MPAVFVGLSSGVAKLKASVASKFVCSCKITRTTDHTYRLITHIDASNNFLQNNIMYNWVFQIISFGSMSIVAER